MTRPPILFNYPTTSEQVRVALGIWTTAELEAQARREVEQAQRQAKDATRGNPLFEELP